MYFFTSKLLSFIGKVRLVTRHHLMPSHQTAFDIKVKSFEP